MGPNHLHIIIEAYNESQTQHPDQEEKNHTKMLNLVRVSLEIRLKEIRPKYWP